MNALERLQRELQQLERELVEQEYVRRTDALERVREAVRRLAELGSPDGVLERAAGELGAATDFAQILISEARGGTLAPHSLWRRDLEAAEIEAAAIALEYPLVEHEVARGRRPELVDVAAAGSRTPARLRELLGWTSYAVGPIVVEGQTIGLLHADPGERPAGAFDLELIAIACDGLGEVFDRATLRDTLQRHRAELQSAAQWIGGRLGSLAADAQLAGGDAVSALTARELEVLALMARGQTNAAIAKALVVQEGTVKYHVKNVLRKTGARSRADAVARYVRATTP